MYSNNQSFFIEEVSQYDIIDESYSIMYKDMQNWHNLQLAIYECVLNEGNIINFIKDIIHKIIETLKKWWKNITDFIKKVINNIKSKLSGRDREDKLLKLDSSKLNSISGKVEIEVPIYIRKYVYSGGFEFYISHEEIMIDMYIIYYLIIYQCQKLLKQIIFLEWMAVFQKLLISIIMI